MILIIFYNFCLPRLNLGQCCMTVLVAAIRPPDHSGWAQKQITYRTRRWITGSPCESSAKWSARSPRVTCGELFLHSIFFLFWARIPHRQRQPGSQDHELLMRLVRTTSKPPRRCLRAFDCCMLLHTFACRSAVLGTLRRKLDWIR